MSKSSTLDRLARPVQITTGRVTLDGDLAIPDGAGARGIVLFAHGSGSSRHSPRNRFVAKISARGRAGDPAVRPAHRGGGDQDRSSAATCGSTSACWPGGSSRPPTGWPATGGERPERRLLRRQHRRPRRPRLRRRSGPRPSAPSSPAEVAPTWPARRHWPASVPPRS